ncbi:prolyl oligopeptidase family serine peptidase [Alienimonas californiensis]|uniref:prolyl oligopeptidase family serine peptidase n=1 Tax=Alienimonas californiensis TaxID=2527989 RepID=UPI0036F34722
MLKYPSSVQQVDDYHGTLVADPFRWLENDVREDERVAEWVKAQNEVTFGYLKQIPQRKAIEGRLTELWNYEKFGVPFEEGGKYYFFKNDGLQNQFVLYVQETLDSEPEVLIDPNTWSEDGTIALSGTAFSSDGKYLAYGVQDAGSDWRTWKVMDLETRKETGDELTYVKFNTPEWNADDTGLYYGRYPEPNAGEKFQTLNLNQKVYLHRLGTPQSEDELVFERPAHPEWGFSNTVTEDGAYHIVTAWKGTDPRYRVFYRKLAGGEDGGPQPWVELIDDFEQEYEFVTNEGSKFYFLTDEGEQGDAPLKRVVTIDVETGERAEVIAEAENVLTGVSRVANLLFAKYLKDATTQVKILTLEGEFVRDVEFEGLGSASGFSGDRDSTETFYSFDSFATPPSVYRYDLATGESELLRRANVDLDPELYEVKQVFYESKDGTRVPMFISYKKGLALDGSNPTLLYGYGGFNIPLTPGFSVSRAAWMEMGGVFAMANLRGGGEYGEAWHEAGTKLKKQNVFDDFIAAAEYLIAEGYTSRDKLAIQGGSNGGLLVGASITQRPDLFAAALPAVGVMDMLRFHQFTAGRFWVDDYGSADDPEEFAALYAYSPYHNLEDGVSYPATLITTADTDDRVVPGHSFKFAARLQQAHAGEAPVLIRIETRAGHGAGKPTEKIIEEYADMWAFLADRLGMTLPEGYGG